ncbi:alkaline phosphatase family protein [Jatrophihabitans telluris]|uniref:Alkaline phosphatase family protein n=1 Tax=Jatrophihabitans telluris TaxID=2038343 RepID=A0ABY4R0Y8_9ACTN|nr:alkaline phosphatase family protein [Jatrophihabitans telluris]UQX88815.1 alkaline phosphatase family protein [Jatrophihabitans telluris]
MKRKTIAAGVAVLTAAVLAASPVSSLAVTSHPSEDAASHSVRYQHIVEIMMENTSYSSIIGNAAAPHLNALANRYGLATNYYGVTHPSEPNYVANIGGDYYGIQDDNQFYCTPAMATSDPMCAGTTVDHTVNRPNLADQLTAANKTWKGYFQSLPPSPATLVTSGPAANGPYTFKYPSNSNALYASKHNPFLNFRNTQGALDNMVPDTQLASDLAHRTLPNYSLVVPDQCHDMHGTGPCSDTTGLISAGDSYVNDMVKTIMASQTWRQGNNAIVITWDEDDYSDSGQPGTGCCGSTVGGGHVVTIVITNQKHPRHIIDNTGYNHYSLLKTMEHAFGLGYLAHAGDSSVPAMTRLFRTNKH